MARALRSRRIGLLALAATCGVLGAGGAGLAQGAGFLDLRPGEGSPGTAYEVEVTCSQEPTLYGHPLNESPPGTQLPLELDQAGPSMWTAVATAGEVDDVYGAMCGEDRVQARFDSDFPRLHLGPVPESIMDVGRPKTTIEGTDCPDGTTAEVTTRIGDVVTTTTAPIDGRGDWSIPLPAEAARSGLRVEASCGDVVYRPLVVAASSTAPEPTVATVPDGAAPPALPADPRPRSASYTG